MTAHLTFLSYTSP